MAEEQCPYCAGEYASMGDLLDHIERAHPERFAGTELEAAKYPVQCPYCEKRFKHSNGLRKHTKEKHPEHVVMNRCPHCEVTYKNWANIRSHIKMSHPEHFDATRYKRRSTQPHRPAAGGYECARCGTWSKTIHGLRSHNMEAYQDNTSQFQLRKYSAVSHNIRVL